MRPWRACSTFVRTYYASDLECHPIYETGCRCDEFSRRGRRPHEHTTDTQLQHERPHRVYRRPTNSVPSLVDDGPRHVLRAPALRVGSSEAGAQPRPVLLRFCAPRTPARGAGFLSLPRNAQPLHWSDQGYAGKWWGGSYNVNPQAPNRPRAGSRALHHEVSRLSSRRTVDPRHPLPPRPTREAERIAGSYAHARTAVVLAHSHSRSCITSSARPVAHSTYLHNRLPRSSSSSSVTAAIEFAVCTD
ncbi:hypothetical protein EDB92DRAFT_302959 [Lactarius akahatsu]|uniref:Uncharacterized protein n=1 Tax=Lactarius akahatsu TaxID=416441 RepID=A0AAD4L6J5_9AGAM|nr:hypothetical protein EDB92DRAFT_302959 [Lactarius akahatsu]